MSAAVNPDVSILVPALDEAGTIRDVVDRLLAVPLASQIIVINDGSTDATGEILAEYGDRILVLTNPAKSGKGNAIRQGLTVATGRVIVIQDADLEYFPEELPRLVEPILKGESGVVFGARFMHGMPPGMAWPNRLVNRLLVLAVLILFRQRLNDEATCYKAVRRDLMLRMDLHCERFEFCPEVTSKAIRLGETIREVPVSYEPRNKAAGKKIRWTDAPEAFWTLLKYRFWRAH